MRITIYELRFTRADWPLAARIFRIFFNMISGPSLTPCFSWVFGNHDDQNRFNGFLHTAETVEAVQAFTRSPITQLKQGVNGKAVARRRKRREISRLGGGASNNPPCAELPTPDRLKPGLHTCREQRRVPK